MSSGADLSHFLGFILYRYLSSACIVPLGTLKKKNRVGQEFYYSSSRRGGVSLFSRKVCENVGMQENN